MSMTMEYSEASHNTGPNPAAAADAPFASVGYTECYWRRTAGQRRFAE
jgi:hypothetical protein